MDLCLILETPNGPWVFDLGEPEYATDLVDRARLFVGYPATSPGMPGDGWCVMLTTGEPHPSLMARAKVGTLHDLAAIDDTEVSAYTEVREAADRAR